LTRSDLFGEHPSVAILPVTSEWHARAFFSDRCDAGRCERAGQAVADHDRQDL